MTMVASHVRCNAKGTLTSARLLQRAFPRGVSARCAYRMIKHAFVFMWLLLTGEIRSFFREVVIRASGAAGLESQHYLSLQNVLI